LGELKDSAINAAAQNQLLGEITEGKMKYFEGVGHNPHNDWPGENSVLILGMTREDTRQLGIRYRQNAVVWCGPDAIPELVLLR
jgi:hypothetical protein